MQDELSSMMETNLRLTTAVPGPLQSASMPSTPQVFPSSSPVAYISQHYHHSGHQVRPESTVSGMLAEAGVDASSLFPSQLRLFRDAAPDQQQRLIELWRIAPPTPGMQMPGKELGNWPQTSMELEEEAAQMRWEASERDRLKNLGVPQDNRTHAEPYIVNGYEHAGDDSWRNVGSMHGQRQDGREWWHMPAAEPIEHQYGLLQHMQMYGQQLDQSAEHFDGDEDML